MSLTHTHWWQAGFFLIVMLCLRLCLHRDLQSNTHVAALGGDLPKLFELTGLMWTVLFSMLWYLCGGCSRRDETTSTVGRKTRRTHCAFNARIKPSARQTIAVLELERQRPSDDLHKYPYFHFTSSGYSFDAERTRRPSLSSTKSNYLDTISNS